MTIMNVEAKSTKPTPTTTVIQVSEDGIHDCKRLRLSNRGRVTLGEPTVSVFRDGGWYFRVGLEFVAIKFCPFCGTDFKNL